jgi:hypothetical protein
MLPAVDRLSVRGGPKAPPRPACKGLELVVVEGRVRPRPGCEHCSRYPARALKSGLGGAGFEVLRVLGGKHFLNTASAGCLVCHLSRYNERGYGWGW